VRGIVLDDAQFVPRIGKDAAQQPYRAARRPEAAPDDGLAAQLLRLLGGVLPAMMSFIIAVTSALVTW
jgi:hypothetical protein